MPKPSLTFDRPRLFTILSIALLILFAGLPRTLWGDEQDELITLLDQAQQAEKQGKLTSPANDNALQRYQQVLAQEKGQYLAWMGMMRMAGQLLRDASLAVTEQDSARATTALDGALAIMKTLGPISKYSPQSETDTLDFYQTRYLYLKDRVRKEKRYWQVRQPKARQNRVVAAKADHTTLSKKESHSPSAETTAPTAKTAANNTASPPTPEQALTPFVGRTLEIPATALQSKSPELQRRLQQVALAAREQQAFLLIVAPTDRAGRWMYDIMKKSVSGYRLRGNIQRGKPRIELQEP